MISLVRSASTYSFFCPLPISFYMIEKKLYSSPWMFNNLAKLTKILYLDEKKNIMQDVLFHFIQSTGRIN